MPRAGDVHGNWTVVEVVADGPRLLAVACRCVCGGERTANDKRAWWEVKRGTRCARCVRRLEDARAGDGAKGTNSRRVAEESAASQRRFKTGCAVEAVDGAGVLHVGVVIDEWQWQGLCRVVAIRREDGAEVRLDAARVRGAGVGGGARGGARGGVGGVR